MHRIFKELARFGTVGAVAFVVDTGLFNLLRFSAVGTATGLSEKPLTVKVISVAVATLVAWLGNRSWTYRDRRDARRSRRRELFLFALVNIAGMLVAVGCLGFSHYVLGFTSALADNISANGVGLVLGTALRWALYRSVVFKAPAEADADTDVAATDEAATADADQIADTDHPAASDLTANSDLTDGGAADTDPVVRELSPQLATRTADPAPAALD